MADSETSKTVIKTDTEALTTTALSELIAAGADAHKNLYKVSFSIPEENNTDYLTVRCEGFSLPQASQDTYTVRYVTAFIDRPRAKMNYEKTFNITFRLDSNYVVYKKLLELQSTHMKASESFASNVPLEKGKGIDVTLSILKDTSSSAVDFYDLYTFKNCWITSVDTIGLTTASSDPVKVQVTFRFQEVNYNNI